MSLTFPLTFQGLIDHYPLFPGVPAMYLGIINSDKVKDYVFGLVRVCVSGSAPLPLAVQAKFGELTGAGWSKGSACLRPRP